MRWAHCPGCKQPRLIVAPAKVGTDGKPLQPPQNGAPRIRQHGDPPCSGAGTRASELEVYET